MFVEVNGGADVDASEAMPFSFVQVVCAAMKQKILIFSLTESDVVGDAMLLVCSGLLVRQ